MGREWERKYAASEDVQQTILNDPCVRALTDRTASIRMESRYFDTFAGAFAAKKQTLRLRTENGRGVVTFKTAEKDGARGEWEYESETLDSAAETLVKLGAPIEPWDNLIEVCGASFTRTALSLVFPDDTKAELALDLGMLTGGGKQLPLAEIEIEHKSGSLQTVADFCDELASRYSLQIEPKSKYIRARMLKEGLL